MIGLMTWIGGLAVLAVLARRSSEWARNGRVAVAAVVLVLMGVLLLPQDWVVGAARDLVPGLKSALGLGWFDLVVHFSLFLAAGLVFGVVARSLEGFVLACVLAVTLEALQWGTVGHQVRVLDGAMNLAGVVVGFGLAALVRGKRQA